MSLSLFLAIVIAYGNGFAYTYKRLQNGCANPHADQGLNVMMGMFWPLFWVLQPGSLAGTKHGKKLKASREAEEIPVARLLES